MWENETYKNSIGWDIGKRWHNNQVCQKMSKVSSRFPFPTMYVCTHRRRWAWPSCSWWSWVRPPPSWRPGWGCAGRGGRRRSSRTRRPRTTPGPCGSAGSLEGGRNKRGMSLCNLYWLVDPLHELHPSPRHSFSILPPPSSCTCLDPNRSILVTLQHTYPAFLQQAKLHLIATKKMPTSCCMCAERGRERWMTIYQDTRKRTGLIKTILVNSTGWLDDYTANSSSDKNDDKNDNKSARKANAMIARRHRIKNPKTRWGHQFRRPCIPPILKVRFQNYLAKILLDEWEKREGGRGGGGRWSINSTFGKSLADWKSISSGRGGRGRHGPTQKREHVRTPLQDLWAEKSRKGQNHF